MQKKMTYKSLISTSVILGIFISMQLKTINLENDGLNTSKRGEQLALQLKALKKEEQELKEEIDAIKEKIDGYRGKEGEKSQEIIKSEIDKYEKLAGYTDVHGKGIEIKIKNMANNLDDDINKNIIYNYDLLLTMINKLNSAQANAISINGQRVVSNTYMHLKSDKLYINETEVKEPFVIKAIGNPDTLASALQIKYGIVWEIEKYYNAKVEIEKKDNIKINGHNEKIDLKYSNSHN